MPLRSYLKSDEARTVLAGKPFSAYVVCRRYWSVNLKEVRKLGTADGGTYLEGIRFTYEGRQVRSLLALLSYFAKGDMRERCLGIKIPPTNLKADFGAEAQAFANQFADTSRPRVRAATIVRLRRHRVSRHPAVDRARSRRSGAGGLARGGRVHEQGGVQFADDSRPNTSSPDTSTSGSSAQPSDGGGEVTIRMATVGDPGNPSVGVVQTFGGPTGQFVDPPKDTGIYKTCSDAPAAPPPCVTAGAVKLHVRDRRVRGHGQPVRHVPEHRRP